MMRPCRLKGTHEWVLAFLVNTLGIQRRDEYYLARAENYFAIIVISHRKKKEACQEDEGIRDRLVCETSDRRDGPMAEEDQHHSDS